MAVSPHRRQAPGEAVGQTWTQTGRPEPEGRQLLHPPLRSPCSCPLHPSFPASIPSILPPTQSHNTPNSATMVDGHEDELTPEQTEGFKVGEKKTIDEYQQLGKYLPHHPSTLHVLCLSCASPASISPGLAPRRRSRDVNASLGDAKSSRARDSLLCPATTSADAAMHVMPLSLTTMTGKENLFRMFRERGGSCHRLRGATRALHLPAQIRCGAASVCSQLPFRMRKSPCRRPWLFDTLHHGSTLSPSTS